MGALRKLKTPPRLFRKPGVTFTRANRNFWWEVQDGNLDALREALKMAELIITAEDDRVRVETVDFSGRDTLDTDTTLSCACPFCHFHTSRIARIVDVSGQCKAIQCPECHASFKQGGYLKRHRGSISCRAWTRCLELHRQGYGRVADSNTTRTFLERYDVPTLDAPTGRGSRGQQRCDEDGLYNQTWAARWGIVAAALTKDLSPSLPRAKIMREVTALPVTERTQRLHDLNTLVVVRGWLLDGWSSKAKLNRTESTRLRRLYALSQTDPAAFAQEVEELRVLHLLAE